MVTMLQKAGCKLEIGQQEGHFFAHRTSSVEAELKLDENCPREVKEIMKIEVK